MDSWTSKKRHKGMTEQEIIDTISEIDKAIFESKKNECPGILVSSDGKLLQLYGSATIHDYVVWHAKKYGNKNLEK
jgi:hypothetical protein